MVTRNAGPDGAHDLFELTNGFERHFATPTDEDEPSLALLAGKTAPWSAVRRSPSRWRWLVVERLRRLWVLALLAPLFSVYPWGGLTLANALLDHGAPEVFRVAVRGKHVSEGKHTSWNLELDPWGPVTERKDVDVGPRLYGAVSMGDRVCVALHPGALGTRWYVVRRCRDGETWYPLHEARLAASR